MDTGAIYDVVSDVEGNFSSAFRNYVRDEKLLCHYWNQDSASDFWIFRQDQNPNDVNHTHCDLTNKLMTIFASSGSDSPDCLVQFWKAEELIGVDDLGDRRFLLSTRNQPFLVTQSILQNPRVSEGLCSYRMKLIDIVTGDGGGGGVIARVYRSKRLELTPNIGYYSSEEYPQLDLARSCGIKFSFAIPISDSFGRLVGVLEAVFHCELGIHTMDRVILEFRRKSNLMYWDHCKHLCGFCDINRKSLRVAVHEIEKVMKRIGGSRDLLCAQTWILCNNCGFLSTINKSLKRIFNTSYSESSDNYCFLEVEDICNMKKGEGVVGRAITSSHNMVYCDDVSRLNITQYPLAHFARHLKLTSCFAICLQSYLTRGHIYVLEFFLNPGEFSERDLRATFISILDDMKQIQSFELVSGDKEIGDTLSVQVIDARFPDKIDTSLTIGMNNIESDTDGTDDPMTEVETSVQDTSMEETSVFSSSTVQSKCWLTIKVNYGGDLFRFQLPSSSEILEVSQQVSQRLNLEGGTYDFKYLDDDNDWILLTCDEDLSEYILSSIQQEKYTLMMWIEPK